MLAIAHDIERTGPVRVPRPGHVRPVGSMPAPDMAAARYGADRRASLPAIALIIAVHAALIFVIMQARHHGHPRKAERLSVINLTPQPPPPAEAPPPGPSHPQIMAPPPLIEIPRALPQLVAPAPPDQTLSPAPASFSVPSIASVTTPAPSSFVQDGDLGAKMIAGKPPRYPLESRRKREQGTVLLMLTLALDGSVETVAISRSSGFARLDDAALDAVRRWRWNPVIQGGEPVRVRGVVEIPFLLKG
ncbi:energy transducer TonB [Sphingobium fuliginis]|nr:energy transducer TonB [Sphingobium fuliginis]QPI75633.1 energy transducer TonB [Sphingobium sp. Cam5-1]